ncbi:MAG: hypothetical protein WC480_00310 [Patescibacteria group bacterium]
MLGHIRSDVPVRVPAPAATDFYQRAAGRRGNLVGHQPGRYGYYPVSHSPGKKDRI